MGIKGTEMSFTLGHNRWQDSFDTLPASDVAQETTMESTMMEVPTASGVTATQAQAQSDLTRQQRWLQQKMAMDQLAGEYQTFFAQYEKQRQQRSRNQLYSMQEDLNSLYQNSYPPADAITNASTPSPSSTKTSTENSAALKQGPLEVRGKTSPSILTGEVPMTHSTSTERPVDEW